MRRRTLLASALLLPVAGCGLLPPGPLVIVCDPDLTSAMERAADAWPGRRGAPVRIVSDISERELGAKMEALQGGLIATREPKQANRIQRMGLARLENRWTREIAGGPVQLVVTNGDFQAEHGAAQFAKWLITPAADKALGEGAAPVQMVLLTAP